jgi:hypothetical protein
VKASVLLLSEFVSRAAVPRAADTRPRIKGQSKLLEQRLRAGVQRLLVEQGSASPWLAPDEDV